MLKTNSKKAAENIRGCIMENFRPEGFTEKEYTDFPEVAAFILKTFRTEKLGIKTREDVAFVDWCAGLPSVLDTCYYYNHSVVDDLAVILEETETEKERYNDESKAETLLTNLIYRELKKAAK